MDKCTGGTYDRDFRSEPFLLIAACMKKQNNGDVVVVVPICFEWACQDF